MPYKQKGFTLIEILVAISIIIVVFGVIISSANAVNIRARDSQRQADLRNIQSALQQYYADQNFYPLYNTGNPAGSLTFGASFKSPTGGTSKTYSNSIPQDPMASNPSYVYCYIPLISSASTNMAPDCDNNKAGSGICTYYKLLAKLENPSSGTNYTASTGSFCNTTASNYNLLVTPL